MAAAPHEFLFQYSDHDQYYKQVTGANNINHFAALDVDELLDFSKEEEDANFLTQNSNQYSSTALDHNNNNSSCNNSSSPAAGTGTAATHEPNFSAHNNSTTSSCGSSSSFFSTHAQFASHQVDLYCVPPYEDLAELEWLSNFVEDSFNSTPHHHHHHQIININPPTTTTTKPDNHPKTHNNKIHPGKARSKRSRSAPCDWSSRLLLFSPAPAPAHNNNKNNRAAAAEKMMMMRRRRREGERKCLHCGSEKTPQWRTGPMGAKTLCNACGVRYKSGRLVPEYRPAASPTFISTKHSNSHRKVLDLRRHNQMQQQQQEEQLFGRGMGSSILFGLSHSHGTYSPEDPTT